MDKKIQIWDSLRLFLLSCIEPIMHSIAMMILVQHFSGNLFHKTMLAMLMPCGLLLSIAVVFICSHRDWGKNKIICSLTGVGSICFFLATTTDSIWAYIILIAIPVMCMYSILPIAGEVYSIYKKEQRAKRFVTSIIATVSGSLLFTYLYKGMISTEPFEYKSVLIMSAIIFFFSALCALKLPNSRLKTRELKIKEVLSVFREDKLFSYISLAWYLLGVGNLWILPYRTNYFLEERYGFSYNPSTILILIVIIPSVCKIIATPIFGWLFDRMNFIALRIGINLLFILYIFLLLFGSTFTEHIIAMVVYGCAFSGGGIAWNLWTTRFAPPHKVSLYMSIHAFLTGTRAILSPLVGLWALQTLGGKFCASIAMTLIFVATCMLFPILKYGRVRFEN